MSVTDGSGESWAAAPSDDEEWTPVQLDTGVANPARVYDYLLGGKDNFAADRAIGDETLAIAPDARERAQENRSFLQRAVRFLARDAGLRQFLDIGAGLPTQGNVHQVVERYAPDGRVVYADNDPIVLAHGRALLEQDGLARVVQADLREPEAILAHPEVSSWLDFERPVVLMLSSILHFITDEEDPVDLVARYRRALAPGSYLLLTHLVSDVNPDSLQVAKLYDDEARASARMCLRTRAQVGTFFGDFELVDPGLVAVPLWRPDSPLPADLDHRRLVVWGGLARKNAP